MLLPTQVCEFCVSVYVDCLRPSNFVEGWSCRGIRWSCRGIRWSEGDTAQLSGYKYYLLLSFLTSFFKFFGLQSSSISQHFELHLEHNPPVSMIVFISSQHTSRCLRTTRGVVLLCFTMKVHKLWGGVFLPYMYFFPVFIVLTITNLRVYAL
jgi:hypothetical protein